VLILPGLSPVIASSTSEARRFAEELSELTNPDVGRQRLSGRFGGYDFSHLPLDTPLTPDDFPDPRTVEAARSRTAVILELVRREQPTLRQLLARLAGARGITPQPVRVAHAVRRGSVRHAGEEGVAPLWSW